MLFNKKMMLAILLMPAVLLVLILIPDDALTVPESLAIGFSTVTYCLGLLVGQLTVLKSR